MYNLFVIIVVTVIFIAILVSYIRGHKTMDNVAVAPIPAAAKAATVPEAAPVPAAAATDATLLVVLAAAAYAALGQNVRVVSVQPVSTEWGVQGRRDIFLSHKIR